MITVVPVCQDCGCQAAKVEEIQVMNDSPDWRDWDIHILCQCPNCKHFGRLSIRRLMANVSAVVEEVSDEDSEDCLA